MVGLGMQWPGTFCPDKPRMVNVLGPDGSGTITTPIRCLRTKWLGIGSGLKASVTHINIFSLAVHFFGLHPTIDQPEGMNMAGYVSENSETDIDQEIAAAAGNKRRSSWWKDDGDDDEADV